MKQKEHTAEQTAKPALIIDAGQYERLLGIAERALKELPGLASGLLEEIERADLRPSDQMPTDVVRIGSVVTYEDAAGRSQTVRVVAPEQADIDRRWVSVLTPIGAALLGLSVGQRIDWPMADGRIEHLTVVAVNNDDGERTRQ